jgi:hypothetical protein
VTSRASGERSIRMDDLVFVVVSLALFAVVFAAVWAFEQV